MTAFTQRTTTLLGMQDRDQPGVLQALQARPGKTRIDQLAAPDDFAVSYWGKTAGARPKWVAFGLHGHYDPTVKGGYPVNGCTRWAPHADRRGGVIVELQHFDVDTVTYLTTDEVADRIGKFYTLLGLQKHSTPAFFHGFSKGGIDTDEVQRKQRWLRGVIRDSVAYVDKPGMNTTMTGHRVVATSGIGDTGNGSSPVAIAAGVGLMRSRGAAVLALSGGVNKPTDHGWFLGDATAVDSALDYLLA